MIGNHPKTTQIYLTMSNTVHQQFQKKKKKTPHQNIWTGRGVAEGDLLFFRRVRGKLLEAAIQGVGANGQGFGVERL